MKTETLIIMAVVAFAIPVVLKALFYSRSRSPRRRMAHIDWEASEKTQENSRQKLILATEFKPVPLMNKKEYKLFSALTTLLSTQHQGQGFRLFTQVGLGAFIQTKTPFAQASHNEKQAFWALNALRADFVIVDKQGYPVVAIEYHGKGHNTENPAYRDVRKQYAYQQIQLPLVTVYFKDNPQAETEEW